MNQVASLIRCLSFRTVPFLSFISGHRSSRIISNPIIIGSELSASLKGAEIIYGESIHFGDSKLY